MWYLINFYQFSQYLLHASGNWQYHFCKKTFSSLSKYSKSLKNNFEAFLVFYKNFKFGCFSDTWANNML